MEEEREDVQKNDCTTETNPVWDFFKVSNRDERLATCNICDVTLSYKSTTTNLCKHLYRKHTITIQEISDQEECDNSDTRIETTEVKNTIDRRKMLRSNIWKLFDVTNWKERMACCKICKHEFSYKSSTSNLFKHVVRMHPDEYDRRKNDEDGDETKDTYETKMEKTPIKIRPRKSVCWRYFKIKNKAEFLAKCKICEQVFSYRTTVSNLYKHVKRKHREVLKDDSFVADDERSNRDGETEDDVKPLHGNRSRCNRSKAWKYFEKEDDNNKIARCKICDASCSYLSSVSNLMKHVAQKHSDCFLANESSGGGSPSWNDNEDQFETDSMVWLYFKCLDPKLRIASCLVCQKRIDYATLLDLQKHLVKKHPHIKLPKGQDATSNHIISEDGQLYEIAMKQEVDKYDDVQNEAMDMDTVYLEDPVDEIYPQRKRKRMIKRQAKSKIIYNQQESSDEDLYQKSEKSDSFDLFGKYIASLLRQLPKKRSDQLQINFVKQIMDAQCISDMKRDGTTNTNTKMHNTHISVPTDTDVQNVTSNTITDWNSRVTVAPAFSGNTETITESDTQIVVTSNTNNEYSIAVTKLPDLTDSDNR